MTDILYKFTRTGGRATHGRGVWRPGVYRTASPPLIPCQQGIHYCKGRNLIPWLSDELWLFEDDGDPLDAGDKMVTTRGRITARVEAWNERTARLFAADCAEAVLPLFEKVRPDDDRPRKAIEVARLVARGAARAAAGAAAGAAAWAAAGAATGDAARDAAGAAARAAAWAAARDATGDAARAAAWAAARAAAGAAARDAAGAAAWDAARAAQTALLFEYLEGVRV